MKLKQLLANVDVKKANVQMDMEITSVVYDSRKVTPGCMFVAVVGYATDGNKYIPMALEKGAAVVVTAKEQDDAVPYVQVASDRLALAQIGGNFFDADRLAVELGFDGDSISRISAAITFELQHFLILLISLNLLLKKII